MIATGSPVIATLRRIAVYPLCAVLFFIVGLYLFFPAQAVRQRLQQELSRQLAQPVTVGDTSLAFPATLVIDQIELATPVGPVPLSNLALSPVWSALFTGTAAAEFNTSVLGGQLTATLDHRQQLHLQAEALHWHGPLPQLQQLALSLDLKTVQLDAQGLPQPQQGTLELALNNIVLSGVSALGLSSDVLTLGEALIRARLEEQQLIIDQLQSQGGDLVLQGQGTIKIGTTPQRTRLDLSLQLIPQPTTDPALLNLLSLLTPADADGHFTLHLQGSLAQPILR